MDTLPRYTKSQLASIVKQLEAVELDGLSVFKVQIINAHTDRPIALKNIRSFGMVYLRLAFPSYVKDFPMFVDPAEEER